MNRLIFTLMLWPAFGSAAIADPVPAATPTFGPRAGTYFTAQTVTITTTTPGAGIRYTTDGSTPSDTVGTLYSGPVTVSTTTTLNAIAYATGYLNSTVATAVYTITPPTIISLSPTSGAPGVQVTIYGSGFGATRGSGAVWLGSTYGTVVSWSDTQVVATVASNSTPGTACLQQGGAWSNSVAFTVTTAAISDVSPDSGVPEPR